MLYMSIATLRARQNPDGGWPYVRGGSWTEPTVYAVMAMSEAGETAAARHGLRWIRATRRDDGGWPPRPGIDQSTWVTALVALLPPEQLGAEAHAGAISRLLGLRGEESTPLYRLRQWLLGIETPREQEFPGWPWVPGTASWVGPTSLAILALEKDYNRRPRPHVIERIEQGACAAAEGGTTERRARWATMRCRIRRPRGWHWRLCGAGRRPRYGRDLTRHGDFSNSAAPPTP